MEHIESPRSWSLPPTLPELELLKAELGIWTRQVCAPFRSLPSLPPCHSVSASHCIPKACSKVPGSNLQPHTLPTSSPGKVAAGEF